MPDDLGPGFWDSAVKALLAVLGGILAFLYRDTRGQIADLRARMEAQEKALAVLASDVGGKQNLLLDKIDGIRRDLEVVTHALSTMSEALINLRVEQGRKEG